MKGVGNLKKWIVLLITIALMALTLTACGGGAKEASAPADQSAAQQKDDSSSNPLDKLMANAKGATELSFDMVMTVGGDNPVNSTSKMYISGKKSRMEMDAMGAKMITIIDAAGDVYLYDPVNNTAMKTAAPQQEVEAPNAWAEKDSAKMEVVGDEKVDDIDCLVVTSTDGEVETKMWLRKDIGMPVRVEVPAQKVVIEYKNFNIGAQDPALFEIPADATVMDLPAMPQAPTP